MVKAQQVSEKRNWSFPNWQIWWLKIELLIFLPLFLGLSLFIQPPYFKPFPEVCGIIDKAIGM